MKVLASCALLVSPVFAALAPDNVADKIFEDRAFVGPDVTRRIIDLRPDGRYTFLYYASGFLLSPASFLEVSAKSDGTYNYVRLGSANGKLILRGDDGATAEIELTFVSPWSGSVKFETGPARADYFTFRDRPSPSSVTAYNMSVRGRVAPGRPLTIGLVVPAGGRQVVIRVIGPSLALFGITDAWADPVYTIDTKQSGGHEGAYYDDWNTPMRQGAADPGAALSKVFSYVGAFPLVAKAKDAVGIWSFPRTNYTIECATKPGDAGGEVLVEVYFLP